MLFQFFRVGHVAVVFNIRVKNNNSKGIVTSYYGNINNYSDRLLQYGTKKTCMETCRWCNFSGTVFGGGGLRGREHSDESKTQTTKILYCGRDQRD